MALTLVVWIYLSCICYAWGDILLFILSKFSRSSPSPVYGISVTCFIGLALIGTLAGALSLFTNMGNIGIQIFFLLPAVAFSVGSRSFKIIGGQTFRVAKQIHPAIHFLLIAMVLMVLVMSVYPIGHPDTLAYHAQLIKWVERYRAVPGLVHVNYLYGLQNNWFVVCALFNFSFIGTNALTFINSMVIVWLILFLGNKINDAIKYNKRAECLYWLVLLLFNLLIYSQIRLTITSGSPDFIAAIYALLTAYLSLKHLGSSTVNHLLVLFLCLFTVTLKLSALPILVVPVFLIWRMNKRLILFSLSIIGFILIPFFARNIITTGYPLFPVANFDFIKTDWQYGAARLSQINQYITYFARFHTSVRIDSFINLPFPKWVSPWWGGLQLIEKALITTPILCSMLLAINLRVYVRENWFRIAWMGVALIGIIFWFVKAPDPRFGTAFLFLFSALIVTNNKIKQLLQPFLRVKILIAIIVLMGTSISAYTFYRFTNYFHRDEILMPAGIIVPTQSTYYKAINIAIPLINAHDKPAMSNDSGSLRPFQFRGNSPKDGFKSNNQGL